MTACWLRFLIQILEIEFDNLDKALVNTSDVLQQGANYHSKLKKYIFNNKMYDYNNNFLNTISILKKNIW